MKLTQVLTRPGIWIGAVTGLVVAVVIIGVWWALHASSGSSTSANEATAPDTVAPAVASTSSSGGLPQPKVLVIDRQAAFFVGLDLDPERV